MTTRIFIVILVAAGIVVARQIFLLWRQRRLERVQRAPVLPELAALLQPGQPTVLAFSTPGCTECRTLQTPALRKLDERLRGQIHVAHLSAPEHPELVSHFGILTVPATVVLDADGVARHVNLRYTNQDRLYDQVLEATELAIAA